MSTTQRATSKIPDFSSYEEEAAFWDTHSTEDFEDEWEPVDWEIGEVRSRYFLRAEVDPVTFRRVRELARGQGVAADELASRWVLEGLSRAEGTAPDDSVTG